MYIGIDIGGTKTKFGMIDTKGNVVDRKIMDTNYDKEAYLDALTKEIQEYATAYSVAGVGISAPGIIDKTGYMRTAGSIKSLYGTNLKSELETRIGLPVVVENDANAAALAERWIGNAVGIDNYLCLVLGTGVGGGIVINGKIYRGAHGMAGEFGWMVIDEPTESEELETASINQRGAVVMGLLAHFNRAKKEAEPKHEKITDARIIFDTQADDPIARSVAKQYYYDLSISMLNLISCFDPELILIGGAISENVTFMTELQKTLAETKDRHQSIAYLDSEDVAPVKAAKLKNDAGMIGAVYSLLTKGA